jgi:ABC-type sugar transport system permease subunit
VGAPAPSARADGAADLPERRVRVRAPGEPRKVAYLYLAPAFAFYLLFAFGPLLYTAWLSFFDWDGLTVGTWIGLDNYEKVLSDPAIRASFVHAFELIIFYAVLPVLLGLLLASLLAHGRVREFFAVTLPGLRGELAVALTITVITALRTFDLIYVSTAGGPGTATTVPSVLVYQNAFTNGRVGLAAAVAVVLTALIFVVAFAITRLVDRDPTR